MEMAKRKMKKKERKRVVGREEIVGYSQYGEIKIDVFSVLALL